MPWREQKEPKEIAPTVFYGVIASVVVVALVVWFVWNRRSNSVPQGHSPQEMQQLMWQHTQQANSPFVPSSR